MFGSLQKSKFFTDRDKTISCTMFASLLFFSHSQKFFLHGLSVASSTYSNKLKFDTTTQKKRNETNYKVVRICCCFCKKIKHSDYCCERRQQRQINWQAHVHLNFDDENTKIWSKLWLKDTNATTHNASFLCGA